MVDEAFFDQHIAAGGKVDATDPMPDAYRQHVVRIIGFQALAEIVGGLLFVEWLPNFPAGLRKMMMTAKCQDEIGHAHILLRVCEDLGKSREEIVSDYLEGRTKLLNIFHYGFDDYHEICIGSLLQNSAAIVQFNSLVNGSYLPYVRALRKIMKEESFHHHHAINFVATFMQHGSEAQKQKVRDGLAKWWPLVLAYFGPPDQQSVYNDVVLKWRLKVDSNDVLRQRWISKMVPLLQDLGLEVPDSHLRYDEATGQWQFTSPDWAEVKSVIRGTGPRSAQWREWVTSTFQDTQWVRSAVQRSGAVAV